MRDRVAVIPIFEPHLPRMALPMRPQAAGLRLLFVGREARRKNLMAVVAAVDALRTEGQSVSLTVVSDFRDGSVAVPAYATVIPGLSQVEVFAAMQSHDVLCMPSFFKTYRMVFIEAMAAGIAVVARDAPIRRSMLGDGARYAAPEDVPGLVAKHCASCVIQSCAQTESRAARSAMAHDMRRRWWPRGSRRRRGARSSAAGDRVGAQGATRSALTPRDTQRAWISAA